MSFCHFNPVCLSWYVYLVNNAVFIEPKIEGMKQQLSTWIFLLLLLYKYLISLFSVLLSLMLFVARIEWDTDIWCCLNIYIFFGGDLKSDCTGAIEDINFRFCCIIELWFLSFLWYQPWCSCICKRACFCSCLITLFSSKITTVTSSAM